MARRKKVDESVIETPAQETPAAVEPVNVQAEPVAVVENKPTGHLVTIETNAAYGIQRITIDGEEVAPSQITIAVGNGAFGIRRH